METTFSRLVVVLGKSRSYSRNNNNESVRERKFLVSQRSELYHTLSRDSKFCAIVLKEIPVAPGAW